MGRRRQAAKEFTKGFAKGAGATMGYGTAGAKIGLLCGGPQGALVGWVAGCTVAMVVLMIQSDTVNQAGEAAQKVGEFTSFVGEFDKSI